MYCLRSCPTPCIEAQHTPQEIPRTGFTLSPFPRMYLSVPMIAERRREFK